MNDAVGPSTNPLNQRIPGIYAVSCTNGSGYMYWVEAGGIYSAAREAADKAHQEWAWEATWPLTFTVTRPDGKVFEVEVERETKPEFHVSSCKEKTWPTTSPNSQ